MASISIIFRKDKINKKNLVPIHFRIIKDRKISYLSSGIKIPEDCWDESKLKIKAKFKNSAHFNALITTKFGELQAEFLDIQTTNKSITTRQIRDILYGKAPTDFIPFARQAAERYLKTGKIGTYDANLSVIKKLEVYVGNKPLQFQDITPEFLRNYEHYLHTKLFNSPNTIHANLKFLRRLFIDAYNMDIIEHHINPFNKYKLKTVKTTKCYLTEEELNQIENLQFQEGAIINVHRDAFVFAAYYGGIRVSDLLLLQWYQFDGTHIHFTQGKTKGQLSFKLPIKALAIINKYKPQNEIAPTGFIFPLVPQNLNLDNPREVDITISRCTAYLNKNLKSIAKVAGIEKKISFHISRHTFATRALRKGITIDKVSKLLGHSSIKETLNYAKIVSAELDKAMDAFND